MTPSLSRLRLDRYIRTRLIYAQIANKDQQEMSADNQDIDLLGYVKGELSHRRGFWREISASTNVPYFTLSKISNGTTKNPRIKTVQALANYFQKTPLP